MFKIKKITTMLTIAYTDTIHQRRLECEGNQAAQITQIAKANMLYPSEIDFIHVDLRSESCEVVSLYKKDTNRPGTLLRVSEFGGAAAWNLYRQIASILPEIDHHTAGRPPVIL